MIAPEVRMVVGVSLEGYEPRRVVGVAEDGDHMVFVGNVYDGTQVLPNEARALARELYKLARRIEARNKAVTA